MVIGEAGNGAVALAGALLAIYHQLTVQMLAICDTISATTQVQESWFVTDDW